MAQKTVAIFGLLGAALIFGCSKPDAEPTKTTGANPSADPAPGATTAAPAMTAPAMTAPAMTAATASGAAASPADLAWTVPTAWKSATSASTMRKATYKIPKAAGDAEDAEMSVTQVGGGVDANVQRWVGQFTDSKDAPKRTTRSVGDIKVTVVEIHGTFAGSGMPGMPAAGPKKGSALLGAIVESTDPPYFFKMTGSDKTVASARADFDKLVGSFAAKK